MPSHASLTHSQVQEKTFRNARTGWFCFTGSPALPKARRKSFGCCSKNFLKSEKSDIIPDAQPTPTIGRVKVFMFHSTQKYVISEKLFAFDHLGWN